MGGYGGSDVAKATWTVVDLREYRGLGERGACHRGKHREAAHHITPGCRLQSLRSFRPTFAQSCRLLAQTSCPGFRFGNPGTLGDIGKLQVDIVPAYRPEYMEKHSVSSVQSPVSDT